MNAASCYAQDKQEQDKDVAEAARQERARKESQQRKSKHIYTAEDLKQKQILTPEDRAQMEARKNQTAPAGPQKPQDVVDGAAVARDADKEPLPPDAPLGDVARRLRRQKESQQLQRSAEFHLPFENAPVLASPKPPVEPLRLPAPVVNTAPPLVVPSAPLTRRSPFERPHVLPQVLPAPHALAPALPVPRVLPTPPSRNVAPSISTKLAIVTIKPGDSLWKYAAQRLGDGRRWQELLSLNPGLHNPDLLKAGSQIVLPASVSPVRTPTKYTVRKGDTLWTIAQSQLRHGSSWSCIAHANPEISNPSLIHEGQVLLVPASCTP